MRLMSAVLEKHMHYVWGFSFFTTGNKYHCLLMRIFSKYIMHNVIWAYGHRVFYELESWSRLLEWNGVGFGVAKVERSAVVMYVAKFYIIL